ncbi:unnamed protein product, partial [Hapterophycus canaliculatus]
ACILHAHLLLLFKNLGVNDVNRTVASVVLSAQVWLMVHHRFDLEALDGAEGIRRKSGGGGTGGGLDRMSKALQIPPTEVFEIITQHRVKILQWMEANPLLANKVLEGVVRVITLTGNRVGVSRKADSLFKDRHWQSIQRINCRGRQAPVVRQSPCRQELEGSAALSYEEYLRRLTQAVDTEVNTQLGEFTLRRHTMETLPRSIEDHPEFQAIFGLAEDSSSTVGCAEVLNTTRRTWLRLVGRRHDVQLWDMDTR